MPTLLAPSATYVLPGFWVFDTRGQVRLPAFDGAGLTHLLDLRPRPGVRASLRAAIVGLEYLSAPQDGSTGAQAAARRRLRHVAAQRGRVLVLVDGPASVATLAALFADTGCRDHEVAQLVTILGLHDALDDDPYAVQAHRERSA